MQIWLTCRVCLCLPLPLLVASPTLHTSCYTRLPDTHTYARIHTQQGEQHGFRKAASIRSALEGELYFYGRVLGFPSSYSDDLQPMFIDNLDVEPSDKTEL